jgi:hypothetical protein
MPSDVYESLPVEENFKRKKSGSKKKERKSLGNVSFGGEEQNRYFYRFSPNKNYAIHLKSSQITDINNNKEEMNIQEINNKPTILKRNYDLNALHLVWNPINSNEISINKSTKIKSLSEADNFDSLIINNRMQQHEQQQPIYNEPETSPIFKIPISISNQQINYESNGTARIKSNPLRRDTLQETYHLSQNVINNHQYNHHNHLQHQQYLNNKITTSLSNHQIYLPPTNPSKTLANNYVKIARSFQV